MIETALFRSPVSAVNGHACKHLPSLLSSSTTEPSSSDVRGDTAVRHERHGAADSAAGRGGGGGAELKKNLGFGIVAELGTRLSDVKAIKMCIYVDKVQLDISISERTKIT
jgi:hypothetical protein